MAARNKRRVSASEEVRRDSVGLHSRAVQHERDLLEEARELQSKGRIREARAVERRARQVDQLVGALECEIGIVERQPDPSAN